MDLWRMEDDFLEKIINRFRLPKKELILCSLEKSSTSKNFKLFGPENVV